MFLLHETTFKQLCSGNIVRNIGVGRFRILGGQGLEYSGGARGAKFPAGTCRRHVPTKFLINQCFSSKNLII